MPETNPYKIDTTPEALREAILALRLDYEAHNHDGASSRAFETVRAEAVSSRAYSIKKIGYSDNTAGLWVGLVNATVKMFLGDGTSFLKWDGTTVSISGTITATAGTIGGWTIGATTISSAASGERIILDQGNRQVLLYNSTGNVVYRLTYGSATTAAYQLIHIQNDARRGIEFIVGSTLGSDAKCITIDNPSTSICIDITDGGSTAINIAGASTSAITITHGGTGAGISVSASGSGAGAITVGGGTYPGIDVTQNGTDTNSFGIRITQDANAVVAGLFVDCNSNSNSGLGIYVDRDGAVDNQIVEAIRIECANSGIGGKAVGIDFTTATIQAIINVAADATDPTGGGGAATGRIPIYVAGVLKYLAYY